MKHLHRVLSAHALRLQVVHLLEVARVLVWQLVGVGDGLGRLRGVHRGLQRVVPLRLVLVEAGEEYRDVFMINLNNVCYANEKKNLFGLIYEIVN